MSITPIQMCEALLGTKIKLLKRKKAFQVCLFSRRRELVLTLKILRFIFTY